MNPAIIILAIVSSVAAIPPRGILAGPGIAVAGPRLVAGLPVAVGTGWNAHIVNTVAAINSGAVAAGHTAALRGANHVANANRASWNDASSLARAIAQQSQANRQAALQAARDQATAINQLAALSHSQRVNHGSRTAQSTSNQASLRQATANQATASQLNAINGGATRDAAIHQAGIVGQIAAVNANAAFANAIRYGPIVAGPAAVVGGHAAVVGGPVIAGGPGLVGGAVVGGPALVGGPGLVGGAIVGGPAVLGGAVVGGPGLAAKVVG